MKYLLLILAILLIVIARDDPSYSQKYKTKQPQKLPINGEIY